MERPQADICDGPPRTNDLDLDERRRTISAARNGATATEPAGDAPRPFTTNRIGLDKR